MFTGLKAPFPYFGGSGYGSGGGGHITHGYRRPVKA